VKRLLLLSATAALWVAGAGIAQAQGEGPYISLGGGWSSLDPVKFNVGGSVGPISGKSSFTNDAAVNFSAGYKFELPIRVEAEVKYTDFDARKLALSTLPAAAVANGDLGVTSFFANVLYDFPLSQHFSFTIGGGVGAALADANLSDRIGDQLLRTGTGFSWQGIAGLTIALSERFQVQLDYRYQSIDDTGHEFISLPGVGDASLKSKNIQAAMLNFRWFVNSPAPPLPRLSAPLPPPPPPPPPPVPTNYVVFFDFNKSDLTPEALQVVASAAATARSTGMVRIAITGHTDTVGSASYNQRLSERRALAVKSQLVADGVPEAGITTVGKGFNDPLVPTGPNVREPQNRRAVIDLGSGTTS
jgi:outer membrane protein OmpA-like peptidoglycan-associated protein/opacity protein-like surface antigen